MGSSPGFGSDPGDGFYPCRLPRACTPQSLRPVQTSRFRYGSAALCVDKEAPPPAQHGRSTSGRLTWGRPLVAQDTDSPPTSTRRIILQKARRQTLSCRLPCGRDAGRPPTACRYRVSGSLSFPSRGAFHLTLTVLVPYRWPRVCSPWRVVPPASHRISRVPWYSGIQPHPSSAVAYRTLTVCGGPSQTLRLTPLPGCVIARCCHRALRWTLQPRRSDPLCGSDPGLGSTGPFARHYLGPLTFDSTSSRY